ncbi:MULTISPECIES: DNA topoisomerase IB [Dyella]|uniref:DNA topoisomerase n=2 Tax=Dyella TaxID=231454 RepID=A0A4R0YT85_9GAMM|nr:MULTISPECIES: DNA topoisomerase IB [Dyella]TBR39845.1 DNA topoisomerase IB [Dyella terrae]TCI12575.1 DNA topoisomerase IB [Dyella soli]
MPRLHYVNDHAPGFHRVRRGRGFAYQNTRGQAIHDPKVLARIRALAIPPAYEEVWICRDPLGHLQATGKDSRGRKQYRYHPQWRRTRDKGKFERLAAFGKALPHLRRQLRIDMRRPGWPRAKVLALIVRLLDQTSLRIGNDSYATNNGHYGLTTLRNHHLRKHAEGLELRFPAKGGRRSTVTLTDARVFRLLRGMQRLPGQRLFQYRDDQNIIHSLESGMVNDYLRRHMGDDFSAKDFRTWAATVEAARQFAKAPPNADMNQRQQTQTANGVFEAVADVLQNTANICRKSYVHPDIKVHWERGTLRRFVGERVLSRPRQLEASVVRLLLHRP